MDSILYFFIGQDQQDNLDNVLIRFPDESE
jgi:hypothetical protein